MPHIIGPPKLFRMHVLLFGVSTNSLLQFISHPFILSLPFRHFLIHLWIYPSLSTGVWFTIPVLCHPEAKTQLQPGILDVPNVLLYQCTPLGQWLFASQKIATRMMTTESFLQILFPCLIISFAVLLLAVLVLVLVQSPAHLKPFSTVLSSGINGIGLTS